MFKEMEADYNMKHFDRKASLERLSELSPEDKAIYESYLVRSVVSEFSGFLLFKEISNRFKKSGRQELGQFFTFLARDEARHAGFLGRALKAEGINVDLPNLGNKRAATFFPLSWVLYSLYLSEKIGYWRYILINRHLNDNLLIKKDRVDTQKPVEITPLAYSECVCKKNTPKEKAAEKFASETFGHSWPATHHQIDAITMTVFVLTPWLKKVK